MAAVSQSSSVRNGGAAKTQRLQHWMIKTETRTSIESNSVFFLLVTRYCNLHPDQQINRQRNKDHEFYDAEHFQVFIFPD